MKGFEHLLGFVAVAAGIAAGIAGMAMGRDAGWEGTTIGLILLALVFVVGGLTCVAS